MTLRRGAYVLAEQLWSGRFAETLSLRRAQEDVRHYAPLPLHARHIGFNVAPKPQTIHAKRDLSVDQEFKASGGRIK